MENKLFAKKIIWNGDSICAGNENTGCWANRIAKNNEMAYANYAVGGGTIAEGFPVLQSGLNRHSVSKTIEKMYNEHPDADYVVFEGGTNDADLFEDSDGPSGLGNFDAENFSGNYDVSTFCGALESVFYRALKLWNGKKICFIVAHKMGELTRSRRKRRLYFDKAVEICKKWGIPYIDLWEGCYLNPCLPWMYNQEKTPTENREENVCYYIDGQHLTSKGYDFTAEIIEGWLKSL